MNPLKICLTVSFFLLLWTGQVFASTTAIIAVFDIQDKSGKFKKSELEQLSTYLTTRLATGQKFRVISRSQIKDALNAQKSESYEACYDESCQIEIGKELAAEKSVMTQIIGVGTQCAVTATLYDLKTSASEIAATEKVHCDPDAVVIGLEKVAAKLVGNEAGSPKVQQMASAPQLIVQSQPVAPQPWSLGKTLRVAGWSVFGLGYLATVLVTATSDPYDGQVGASLIPIYGPLQVEAINITKNYDSGGLPYLGLAVQSIGLASLIVGYFTQDKASPPSRPTSSGTSYFAGVTSNGAFLGGRF